MATVRLGRYELEEYDLPKVCMRCGARASHYKSKRFQWSPPWAFFVLGVLGALIFMKNLTVPVPLCERHKWHWGSRMAFALLGILVIVAWAVAGAVVAGEDERLAPFIFIPLVVLLLGYLITLIALSLTTIRPVEITDKSITLRGVSEEFIEALDEERRGDDEDRPRRDRARYEDDEEDRPRRKRRAAADDGGYYDPERRRHRPAEDEDDDR